MRADCEHPLQVAVTGFYGRLGLAPDALVGVALSGGADSMALLVASVAAGMRCVALHCNFHLRGAESDRDEAFSCAAAEASGCEFRCVHFDAAAEAKAAGESVEMACRRLRYAWFEEMLSADVAVVALGHHSADNVETFMLNLARGSGLRGLCGIPERRGRFVRPLLSVSKSMILDYLRRRGLDYIVDSTNLVDDCRRNVWRNRLLPAIEAAQPGFIAGVERTIGNISADRRLLEALISREMPRLVGSSGAIDMEAVSHTPEAPTLLWHLMNMRAPFGIETARHALESFVGGRSGGRFLSADGFASFQLNRSRLVPLNEINTTGASIAVPRSLIAEGGTLSCPLPLNFEVLARSEFAPSRNPSVAWFDRDALLRTYENTPCGLQLRHWRQGDRIRPFGMRGSRLVSDVFSDAHLSADEKSAVWLLTAADTVLWIVGMRTSALMSVSASSAYVVRVSVG